ncbi:hypothetical protein JZ751_022028 [Albula glossodonta]|uniref:C-C motif chemokine n=1 Tax=Albula glossodonta TaxID=121402 RepID=A0A8T2NHK6_9TELE|nr:hypothetical protein JZ751_022028 [Albula glossodonta]
MASTRFFAVALLVIFTLNAFLLQTESASCCLSYTKKKLHCKRMDGYTMQTMTDFCDLNAIIFQTKSGRFVCADPAKDNTKRIIKCLTERTKILENSTESSGITNGTRILLKKPY